MARLNRGNALRGWPASRDALGHRRVVLVLGGVARREVHRAPHAPDDLPVHDVRVDDVHAARVLLER
jgi:hypothetical protein